jgi:hypothetical protein
MTHTNRLVAKLIAQPLTVKVRHYWGFPPELTSGENLREQMPFPAVLLIETDPDGVFLFRFTADGQVVGDTWHETIEDAQHQATFEYENSLSDWIAVPPDVEDVVAFALRKKSHSR